MGNNPTMKDVAREAGVSLGTVSKVMNGIPVGEEYRIKVEDAAERLGYQVNAYARGLKTNKTNMVAVILPNVIHPFFGALAQYCNDYLRARGYNMLLATTSYDAEAEKKCIAMVKQNKVDGIICLSYNADLEIDDDLPFVSIDRYYNAKVPCIASDNFGGGQLAAQKLYEFGCRKLLCLRDSSKIPGEADKRNLGFASYCQLHNIDHEVFLVYESHHFQEFYDYLDQHITNGRLEFDGIFCGTDHLAYRISKYLISKGIRIPEDVQLIGFDGLRKFGFSTFYVSTIVQPVKEIAQICVNTVLSEQQDRISPLMYLPVSFEEGGTTRKQPEAVK